MDTVETDVLIIGAGVVGLAVARTVSSYFSTLVVEKHPQFGQETSSRNSEVVHSGIHYPLDSQKTFYCIRGRDLLYEYCETHRVPFKKCGKYVVATRTEETEYLEKLRSHCQELDVPVGSMPQRDLSALTSIQCQEALFLPLTGIVDSHSLMSRFEKEILDHEGIVIYNHEVLELEIGEPCTAVVRSPDGELNITSRWILNCAGLSAADLSNRVLRTTSFEHKLCQGRYFVLNSKYQNLWKSLIYPVPQKDGLGIHITIDLDGFARLGPDVEWLGESRSTDFPMYDCNWETIRPKFLAAVHSYCPTIQPEELTPGLVGVRPKLFVNGQATKDFLIEQKGNFIHCLGIESPGLTSCLSIAETVLELIKRD